MSVSKDDVIEELQAVLLYWRKVGKQLDVIHLLLDLSNWKKQRENVPKRIYRFYVGNYNTIIFGIFRLRSTFQLPIKSCRRQSMILVLISTSNSNGMITARCIYRSSDCALL